MSRTPDASQYDQAHVRTVGRVAALWRYPVKSMGAEPLDRVELSWHGLAGDRRWAFVRGGVERSGFPWLTIRQKPDMMHFQPRLVDPARPDTSPTLVRTPGGVELDVVDPALGAALGHDARVLKQDRGAFDAFPLSLITTQSIASLEAIAGIPLDAQRFRPNLLVDTGSTEAFPEDDWVGSVLRIGSAAARIDKRDRRCVVVNIDPETAEGDPAALRAVARARDGYLGVYGSTVRPGSVAVGDAVYLERGALASTRADGT